MYSRNATPIHCQTPGHNDARTRSPVYVKKHFCNRWMPSLTDTWTPDLYPDPFPCPQVMNPERNQDKAVVYNTLRELEVIQHPSEYVRYRSRTFWTLRKLQFAVPHPCSWAIHLLEIRTMVAMIQELREEVQAQKDEENHAYLLERVHRELRRHQWVFRGRLNQKYGDPIRLYGSYLGQVMLESVPHHINGYLSKPS